GRVASGGCAARGARTEPRLDQALAVFQRPFARARRDRLPPRHALLHEPGGGGRLARLVLPFLPLARRSAEVTGRVESPAGGAGEGEEDRDSEKRYGGGTAA